MDKEKQGPAETIIQTLLTYSDHAVHNRPGIKIPDARTKIGVRWEPVTHKLEENAKVVYGLSKVGKKTTRTKLGVMQPNGAVVNGRQVGFYQPAGLFPEVVAWMYRQVADVWKLDNEFAARWASYAYGQEHRDLKAVLAAFMLVQSRRGDPVKDNGKVAFFDQDFRDVGEAMMLLFRKDGKDLNPKMLIRLHEILSLPEVAQINRELGFGKSAKEAFLGRWPSAVQKWLRYREENPRLLEGLIKAGFRSQVIRLAQFTGYKPISPRFFELLRWKQEQSEDGRRQLAIGAAVAKAESWEGLEEAQICEKIVKEKPNFKRIVGLLPKSVGLSRAVVAAAIEAGSLSDKDLVILTPTLEELGLLQVQSIKDRWERATKNADDMRAANIATRVRSTVVKEKLEEAADKALQKAVEEVIRDIRVHFIVDISGSMAMAIEQAKLNLARFLQGFPPDKVHVAVFNTMGREITIPHASAAGVENAFRGIAAGGGTSYAAGVRALSHRRPKIDEDLLVIFVGDEQNGGGHLFDDEFRRSGLTPMAFGFVRVTGTDGNQQKSVQDTAARLGIPCFLIDERTFADPYAIPRTIRALVSATPVGRKVEATTPRVTIIDTILKTDILSKPVWAA